MFDKFRNIFRFSPKEFLGIDIGSSFIRMIELEKKNKKLILKNYGEIGLLSVDKPFRVIKDDSISFSNKEIAKGITAVIQEAEMTSKNVAFSIPDFASFFTKIELPAMDKDEIPEAVKYQVRPYIPLPLEDVTLDWSIVQGVIGETVLKILVVAIPNEIVAQYEEIAHFIGLKLNFLEPEVFSLARSSTQGIKNKEVIGLVDIGAKSTTCSVIEKGVLKISHSFNIAGDELTRMISSSLSIDYGKAEEIKKQYGLLPDERQSGSKNIRSLLMPLVGSILDEVKKAFRNYYLQEGKEVEEIVLSGGVSLTPGLKEFFSIEMKKPIIIINPFLEITSPIVLKNALKELSPYYGVAVGLALKGLE
jgi:type IV pilus assembly protein PilM